MVLAAGGLAGADQAVHQLDRTALDPGAQAEGVVLDVGHRLGAAGDDQGAAAAGDLRGGVEHRLQAGAAAAVELEAGHAGAETRVEGGDAADGRVLAAGVAVAEDHVVDVALLQARPTHELGQGGRRQVDGGQGGERAPEATHRGAYGFTDDDVGHGSNLIVTFDTVKYPFGCH